MKKLQKKQKRLIILAVVVVLAVLFCFWLFDWGKGTINVMNFSVDDVESLKISSTRQYYHSQVSITDPEDIQRVIDSVNSFRYTGKEIREIFKYGIGAGGTCVYSFVVELSNGEQFSLMFGSNNGEQPASNMEVSFWTRPKQEGPLHTCRGSLEFFFELYEKYSAAN